MVSGILEVYIFVKRAVSFRDGNRFGDMGQWFRENLQAVSFVVTL